MPGAPVSTVRNKRATFRNDFLGGRLHIAKRNSHFDVANEHIEQSPIFMKKLPSCHV